MTDIRDLNPPIPEFIAEAIEARVMQNVELEFEVRSNAIRDAKEPAAVAAELFYRYGYGASKTLSASGFRKAAGAVLAYTDSRKRQLDPEYDDHKQQRWAGGWAEIWRRGDA